MPEVQPDAEEKLASAKLFNAVYRRRNVERSSGADDAIIIYIAMLGMVYIANRHLRKKKTALINYKEAGIELDFDIKSRFDAESTQSEVAKLADTRFKRLNRQ